MWEALLLQESRQEKNDGLDETGSWEVGRSDQTECRG